jgi:biopolymer transport protein ExbB
MNLAIFHEASFIALYMGAILVTFLLIERSILYYIVARDTNRILRGDQLNHQGPVADLAKALSDTNLSNLTRHSFEDITDSAYLRAMKVLKSRLWLLDTTITAAPLIGLLGTILGIIDTFLALAQSGISDPSSVSSGIGTALYATALGITVALYGLLVHNYFQERLSVLSDRFKDMILRGAYHGN